VPESASGLRPASAFFVVGAVLCVVGAWVAWIALGGEAWSGFRPTREQDPPPEYTICDRNGRPLAAFVQRLDLSLSPRALWQAHTPQTIAVGLARALGASTSAQEMLERMLPDAKQGVVRAAWALNETQARSLDLYLRRGSHDLEAPLNPIRGMWLERAHDKGAGVFTLAWQPQIVLSSEVRESHLKRQTKNPLRWSRELADGIAVALLGERAVRPGQGEKELERQRAQVWEGLMPTRFVIAMPDFDATRAPDVWEFLNAQHVASHQMSIERNRNRRYPLGKMRLLGGWGYIAPEEGERRALVGFGIEPALARDSQRRGELIEALVPADRRRLDVATWELLSQPEAIVGLELVCDQLLSSEPWKALARVPAGFEFYRHRPIRQIARGQGSQARAYYLNSTPASDTPLVFTTIDARLQAQVEHQLELVMQRSKPAVAMAIVIDVESGDVLAVDSREAYPFGGFAPTTHTFTPGSTGKLLVMATALEAGLVSPEERIDVGHGEYRIPDTKRVIHEAENPGRSGVISAAECLAFSLNAGLVRIGLRIPAQTLRETMCKLHYAERPGTGFPGERPGMLPALPWKKSDVWASVCFGHGYMTTMWQHAAAMAAIERLVREARPGLRDFELGAIVEHAYRRLGGAHGICFLSSAPMTGGGRTVPAQVWSDRMVERGDMILVELSVYLWGASSQALRTITLGDPPERLRDLHGIADRAFGAIEAAIQPGVPATELLEVAGMIDRAGATVIDDVVHGYGGGYLPPVLRTPATQVRPVPDLILRPGMLLVVQPNVVAADRRLGVQTGELLAVTEGGPGRLHGLRRGLLLADAVR
jgi:cell division protein FtsI/penicillin-binding protein 2